MGIKLACKHFSIQSVYWLFYGGLIEYNTKRVALLIYWFRDIRRILHCCSHSLFLFLYNFYLHHYKWFIPTENNKRQNQDFLSDGGFTFFSGMKWKIPVRCMQFRLIVFRFSEIGFWVLWLRSCAQSICPSFVKFILRPEAFEGFALEIRITFVTITFGWVCVCLCVWLPHGQKTKQKIERCRQSKRNYHYLLKWNRLADDIVGINIACDTTDWLVLLVNADPPYSRSIKS